MPLERVDNNLQVFLGVQDKKGGETKPFLIPDSVSTAIYDGSVEDEQEIGGSRDARIILRASSSKPKLEKFHYCRAPRYCRITPLLYELHWLPVRQRISFKILLFVFKAIHGFAPTYLRELVSIKRSGNYNLRSSLDGLLLATPTYRSRVTLETDHSRSQLRHFGMYYLVRFVLLQI